MSSSKVPYITLNNGQKIPQLGIGTPYDVENIIEILKLGYRHIDNAHFNENENEIGQAVKKCGIPREEIFITSKLWITEYGEGVTLKAVDKMLKRFGLDYIDLIMLHFPFND